MLPIHRKATLRPPVFALNFTRRIPFPAKATLLLLAMLLVALAAAAPLHAADNPAAPVPRAIKQRVNPQYPEIAKRMHVSGTVKIEASVNAEGTVTATKTIAGNRMLATAAEEAVHQWKFVAASESSTVEVEINFNQSR
jgi:TonB family protein